MIQVSSYILLFTYYPIFVFDYFNFFSIIKKTHIPLQLTYCLLHGLFHEVQVQPTLHLPHNCLNLVSVIQHTYCLKHGPPGLDVIFKDLNSVLIVIFRVKFEIICCFDISNTYPGSLIDKRQILSLTFLIHLFEICNNLQVVFLD